MDLKNVKTLISSSVMLIAVALYMVFGNTPATKEKVNEEKQTQTNQASTPSLAKSITVSLVENKINHEAVEVQYVQAYDGDTIQVELNGQKESVRMLMIDCPEMRHKQDGKQLYAQEATDLTKSLLENAQKVELVYDVGPERDKYNRILAYVFVDGKLVQERLLAEGLAVVRYIYKPNNSLEQEFLAVENIAKEKRVNIWSHENYFQKDGFHPEMIDD